MYLELVPGQYLFLLSFLAAKIEPVKIVLSAQLKLLVGRYRLAMSHASELPDYVTRFRELDRQTLESSPCLLFCHYSFAVHTQGNFLPSGRFLFSCSRTCRHQKGCSADAPEQWTRWALPSGSILASRINAAYLSTFL